MIQNFIHKNEGTCSSLVKVSICDDIIQSVEFEGGCPGNLEGISKLVAGMRVDDVIERFEGIRCGNKSTSCPDQLAKALIEMKIRAKEAISCSV